jgi:hypothetical protein
MAVPNYYPLNAKVRIVAKFRARNANQGIGDLTNPTTVIFSYETPNGTETDVTYPASIIRPATGIYYLDITASIVGTWRWRTDGDGSVEEGEFVVDPSVFS